MSVPDLPFVRQKHWGSPLNAGIKARTSSDYLADKLAEDGQFRSSLMSTIDTRVSDGLGDLDGTDTGAAGLAVLAAALPADAREALNITIDTSVGTRVIVGGVMVYGDTGWRDMSGLLAADVQPSSNLGVCDLRRVNDTVYYNIKVDVHETTGALFGAGLPSSWLPSKFYYLPAYSASNTGAGASALSLRDTPIYVRTGVTSPDRFSAPASAPFPAQSTLVVSGNYPVTTPWPTTLPGLPA